MALNRRAVEPTDEELIARVANGDRQAFAELYARYADHIARFVYRTARSAENAEEIVNDVMLVVWQKAATFNNTSKVSTWILGIAYKKALKTGATTTLPAPHVDFDEVEPLLPGARCSDLQGYELHDWFERALALLSPEQRAVMELTCVQGLAYDEIAVILGCPENTVKTRMFHARKKLKSMLPELTDDRDLAECTSSL